MNFIRNFSGRLIFLLIGILTGFFISRLPIKFEEKISWIALSNFFLTIGIALYVEFIVRPSFANNRNEKDYLIDQLKLIKDTVATLNKTYTDGREEIPVSAQTKRLILTQLREVSNLIEILRIADEYCKTTKGTIMSGKIIRAYFAYKAELTGYNFDNADFAYDQANWNKNIVKFQSLTKLLMLSILDINNA